LRNRLGDLKVNDELLVRSNNTSTERSQVRKVRIMECFAASKEKIRQSGHASEDECSIIERIDASPTIKNFQNVQRKNYFDDNAQQSEQTSGGTPGGKKTKIFAMISRDPSIMGKRKRSSKKYQGDDDDDDDEEYDPNS
jgi:hypothetical protein